MSLSVIYKNDDLEVLHDSDVLGGTVIGLETDGEAWLNKEDALAVVNAVLKQLEPNEPVESVQADGSLGETLLAAAIKFGCTTYFGYAKGNGNTIEQRKLTPYEIREVPGGKIVFGYDPDREDVRAYRLDRIKGGIALS